MSRQRRFVRDAFVSAVKMLAAAVAVAVLVGVQNVYAARLYVNASSTGTNPDESSWAKAFHNLQDASGQGGVLEQR